MPAQARPVGTVLAIVLGGVAAGAIGFGAAYLGRSAGEPTPDTASSTVVEARIGTLSARMDDLETSLVRSAELSASALDGRLAGLTRRTSGLEDRLNTLATRLDALEATAATAAPDTGAEPAALADLRDEMATLRAALAAQQARNDALSGKISAAAAEAEARISAAETRIAVAEERAQSLSSAARGADIAVALSRLHASVETGRPYAHALAALAKATGTQAPPVLEAHATSGVASLASLQDRFPAAARAGLSATLKATVGDGWRARVTAYLRSQLGARSLEPKAGSDPDAVLSRAEAALTGGDLAQVLSELASLHEAGRAAMADWLEAADARLSVYAALDDLATRLDGTN